jgi:hypothetical protein
VPGQPVTGYQGYVELLWTEFDVMKPAQQLGGRLDEAIIESTCWSSSSCWTVLCSIRDTSRSGAFDAVVT